MSSLNHGKVVDHEVASRGFEVVVKTVSRRSESGEWSGWTRSG